MASTEQDTAAATGAAAAGSTTAAGGVDPGEGTEASATGAAAAASPAPNDETGPVSEKPSDDADNDDADGKPKKTRLLEWELAKELPSPERNSNPFNRSQPPVSQIKSNRVARDVVFHTWTILAKYFHIICALSAYPH